MRAYLVEVFAPGFDDDLGLGPRPEPLHAEAFVTERLPLYCSDLLHHLNLQIALRHQLLQPRILLLELLQACSEP